MGGTILEVTADRLELREGSGQVVTLQRLRHGATAFFRPSGGRWIRVAPETALEPGDVACVEILMDGESLLALRVFLGAGCGPV